MRKLVPLLLVLTVWRLAGLGVVAQASPDDEVQPVYRWYNNGRISIVWPHDGRGNPTSVAQSRAINLIVWPGQAVDCQKMPEDGLWVARNNEPALQAVVRRELVLRQADGFNFPTLVFNDIPVDLQANPTDQYRFFFGSPDYPGNLWVHAADGRTFQPQPVTPTGQVEGDGPVEKIDARIQIVWPHDGRGNPQPVNAATHVNVLVDLFEHGTLNSLRDFPRWNLVLYSARENAPFAPVMEPDFKGRLQFVPAQAISYTVGSQVYPRWAFNNVPVEAGQQSHFMVVVRPPEPLPRPDWAFAFFPTIWTHASDARTIYPDPMVPTYDYPALYRCQPETAISEPATPLPVDNCRHIPQGGFYDVWTDERVQPRLGCAVAPAEAISGTDAYLACMYSIWLRERRLFVVLEDMPPRWSFVADQSGMADDTPLMQEPAPREDPFFLSSGRHGWLVRTEWLYDRCGVMARSGETPFNGALQEFAGGWLLWNGANTFVLFKDDWRRLLF